MRVILLIVCFSALSGLEGKPGDEYQASDTRIVDRLLARQRERLREVDSLRAIDAPSQESTSPLDAVNLGIEGAKGSIKASWENHTSDGKQLTWAGLNFYVSTSLEVTFDTPLAVHGGKRTIHDENLNAAFQMMLADARKTIEPGFKPEQILLKKFSLTVGPKADLSRQYAEMLMLKADVTVKGSREMEQWEGVVFYERRFKSLREIKSKIERESLNIAAPLYEFTPNRWGESWYFVGSAGL
jgi:hypothetical protein